MTTVVEALVAVMRDVSHVAKRDRNKHQGFDFRGVDAVVNAVGPALRNHGVVVVPSLRRVEYASVRTTQDKPATACRVEVAYTFHGPEGDSLPCSVVGEAWDVGDKATPKAMSVAFRTALLQALCLPTDSPDPDHDVYERADRSEADQLRDEIKAVAGERKIPLRQVAEDFAARTRVDIADAEPKLLTHYLGHLRTHGLASGEKTDAATK